MSVTKSLDTFSYMQGDALHAVIIGKLLELNVLFASCASKNVGIFPTVCLIHSVRSVTKQQLFNFSIFPTVIPYFSVSSL